MNYTKTEQTKKIIRLVLLYTGVVIILIIAALIYNYFQNKNNLVINSFDSIVKNLPKDEKDRILNTLDFTLRLNSIVDTKSISDITIREGSYSQTLESGAYITRFIIDINSIRQSYVINDYYPTNTYARSTVGDYSYTVNCVFGDEVIYSDFKCKDRISDENQMPWADPVQNSLPINNTFYVISLGINNPDSDKIVVDIRLNMPKPTRDNNKKAAEFYKEQALKEFTGLGYNLEDYIITYSWL